AGRGRVLQPRAVLPDLLHLGEGGEELTDVAGQVGVAVDVLLQRRPLPPPVARRELVGQAGEQGEPVGAIRSPWGYSRAAPPLAGWGSGAGAGRVSRFRARRTWRRGPP